jgi:flavin reductase (DIM6/NTAB) family NADH-FMN oxidoreductase RutF
LSRAPVELECRHYVSLEVALRRHLYIGSVAHLHARQGIDPERLCVNVDPYKPVARLFGNLARLDEKFTLKRQFFAEWRTDNDAHAAAERAEAWY